MAHEIKRRVLLGALLLCAGQAAAAEIHVLTSGAFTEPLKALGTEYERESGDTLVRAYGPSMGETPQAIPNRLKRGEPADVVILARGALDALVREGRIQAGSEVDLVRSGIAMAVRAGAKRPDISSVEGLKRALVGARSIAYSDSASGVYLSKELFPRLGISAEMAAKSRQIQATPVGEVVARGEAELGFQQLSELLPVTGIEIVGPLPEGAQRVTIFAAGVTTTAKSAEAARRLIAYLASEKAWPSIRKAGLEPVSAEKRSAAAR